MTHNLYLDWVATASSLFNTILLFWLGATVLLNAERRTWGIWLAGGGLLAGAAFFVSHTAILRQELNSLAWRLDIWWYAGLALAVAMPLSWYLAMLWYSGFWERGATALRRRQRPWLALVLVMAAGGAVTIALFADPLAAVPLPVSAFIRRLAGASWLVAAYALYLVACTILAVDALLRPGPNERMMGGLARRRARRWLLLASLLLLLVSLAVVAFLLWALPTIRQSGAFRLSDALLVGAGQFDLVISLLIGAAVVALGQAVVAYEIFTGKSLPRRGLRRQWQQVLLLGAGFTLLAGAVVVQGRPLLVYGVLLAAILMTGGLSLLSRRAYSERRRYLDHLRPFIASQRLYDRLLLSNLSTLDGDLDAPFRALCQEILGARRAFLVPLGPMAPLAGEPLCYPGGDVGALPRLSPLVRQLSSPQMLSMPVDPSGWAGACWAVPLWGTRGLIGVLLLGEKQDGSLYTEEEIEIARAAGERLLDTRASIEMSRRLLALQRRQLAATQVADRRTRRVLHDDVLPHLHAALLALDSKAAPADAIALLSEAHREISDLLRDAPATTSPAVIRLGVVGALRHAVEKELADAFDAVSWELEAAAEQRVQALSPLQSEVLFYAAREVIRNAARHGRGAAREEQAPLCLRIAIRENDQQLELILEDNGVGAAGGAGQRRGLALHSTMMAIVGGALALESEPGRFTRVRLTLTDEAAGAQS